MKFEHGDWINAVITIATDDDLTPEVNLGKEYYGMQVIIPTIDSANVSVQVAKATGGTFYDLGVSEVIPAGTGNLMDVISLGGFQYIKVKTSAAQTSNRTFEVRGFDT